MSKGKVIIVDCIKSTAKYFPYIYEEGYEAVLLEPFLPFFLFNYYHTYHKSLVGQSCEGLDGEKPTLIKGKKNYDKTLEMIKELNPAFIIPGSDDGFELATKLAEDLGLVGNGRAFLEKAKDKYTCQKTLEKAGVRSIKSAIIKNEIEALDFYRKNNKKPVVIKPLAGVGSLGVYICNNEEEIVYASKRNNGRVYSRFNKGVKGFLIQEYIDGEEYIVNTVSCEGKHKVTAVYKYNKITMPNKGKIYNGQIALNMEDKETQALIDYQINGVLNTLGFKVGPVHSEIMIDKNGPVLIEANYRLEGINIEDEYLEKAWNIREVKEGLLTYLRPSRFKSIDKPVLFTQQKVILIKYIILYESVYISRFFYDNLTNNLPGYYKTTWFKHKGICFETVNYTNAPGRIYFLCNDKETAIKNFNYIDEIEKKTPNMLYEKRKVPFIGIINKIYKLFT